MTRKDYVAIAQAINASHPAGDIPEHARVSQGRRIAAVDIATRLADHMQDNPRFDRARFLAACGVQS